jgi:hypothetical protein
LSQIGFNRMRNENAGAERSNKRGRQLKHWKSPVPPPAPEPIKSPAFQEGFVALEKWFRHTRRMLLNIAKRGSYNLQS